MSSGDAKSWPVVDIPEAYRILTAPGAPFEMEEQLVRGRKVRVYKNARNSLYEIFGLGRSWGEREYIVYEGERQTYADHFKAAGALGRILSERYGVKKGDRIVIAMRNLPEFSIALWAGVSIGAVMAPLNAWGLGPDLAYGVSDSGAKVVIADGERLERLVPHLPELNLAGVISVRAANGAQGGAVTLDSLIGPPSAYGALPDDPPADPGVQPDDDATILYTSGTTGKPKGALGTHRNVMSNLVSIAFGANRSVVRRGGPPPTRKPGARQRVNLLTLPLFHVTGLYSVMVPAVAAGGKLVLMHKWNPERFLELIEAERVNATSGVPAMVWQALESPDFHRRDLSSLDSFGSGGAAVAPELTLRFAREFPHIPPGQGYGATETSSVCTSNSGEDYVRRPDSVGPAVPVVDLMIADADGKALPPGGVGEIWVRGPNVVVGYWNNPEATARSFTDGWYHTGDVGRMDEEGFVYVMDRIKDMLIRGGENIYCVEIEDVLITHPAVIDAAVIGLPHRIWGEEVGALVQLKPGAEVSEADLIAHVARVMPPYKVPVRIDVRQEEFPRNASGKTLKPKLREEMLAKLALV
jgi:long-chain acyl-CoA synthetase